ncbi:hypothetical protein ACR9E3_02910 [Actinomycetospora sp. C-140]
MHPDDRSLLARWIPVVTLAELAGFALPAVVGVLTAPAPASDAVPALVGAGVVEGMLLGAGQALVLRRVLPRLSARRWIGATASGAALAYLLGLLPSTVSPVAATWPAAVLVLLAVPLGVLLLASIGGAQWLELRRHVDRAGWWVAVTALAWLLGLGVFLAVATPLWQPGQTVLVSVLVGLAAGALMALVMATVTGLGLVRLLATAQAPGTPEVPFGPGPGVPRARPSGTTPMRRDERQEERT